MSTVADVELYLGGIDIVVSAWERHRRRGVYIAASPDDRLPRSSVAGLREPDSSESIETAGGLRRLKSMDIRTNALPVELPANFAETRDGLRALACYVIAPARKARTGRIGLRATDGGFGTPELPDGSRVLVRGDRLISDPGGSISITSLHAAAEFLSVPLSADPGVGSDLPPFEPLSNLRVDRQAALALGAWYDLGTRVLGSLRSRWDSSETQLWPEHFDLAVALTLSNAKKVNVGFSPGDIDHAEPYVFVGPHDTSGLSESYWNASFGARLDWDALVTTASVEDAAEAFIVEGLELLTS